MLHAVQAVVAEAAVANNDNKTKELIIMDLKKLALKEMFQHRNQLFSSLIAITLGIAAIVGIKNITYFSEKAVSSELDTLGANVLILPKSASVQDYYSADFQEEEIPEDYVNVLVNSDIKGIDNLSPKLNLHVEIQGQKAILTGILPKNEFKSKTIWQGTLGVFSRPEGCGTPAVIPGITDSNKNITKKRVIEDLGENKILVGSDLAKTLEAKEGSTIKILNKDFIVEAVLPVSGTIDDNRIFAHLHTVQQLGNKTSLLNAIEIVGCCAEISKGLIQKLNKLLPDARVVTITQIVQTQLNTNRLMNKLSIIVLIMIVLIGGASIANYMFADVYERSKEIGILMAMGANNNWLMKLFLYKSIVLGAIGGITGYLIGTIIAVVLGPKVAGIPVSPLPIFALYSLVLSMLISVVASILPVIKATKVDPFVIMQEE